MLFLSDNFNNCTLNTVNDLEKSAIEKAVANMPSILENKVAPKCQILDISETIHREPVPRC